MKNPLNIPQRETAGSSSYEKFDYQYHYALYWLLEKSLENKNIAVFIEYHNDVVLAEDLDIHRTKFYFAQIKANEKHLTLNQIIKKGKNGELSILNKLCPSNEFNNLLPKIRSIELVSANGFNFISQKSHFRKISRQEQQKIKNSLDVQLDQSKFLSRLFFTPSKIATQNIDSILIGELDKLVERLYPNTHRMANQIYGTLMNDLRKKGKRRETYPEWDTALKQKALSFDEVQSVIQQFTSVIDNYKNDTLKYFEKTKPKDLDPLEEMDYQAAAEKYSIEQLTTISISAKIKENISIKMLSNLNIKGEFNFNKLIEYAKIIEGKLSISGYHCLIIMGVIYEFIKYRAEKIS